MKGKYSNWTRGDEESLLNKHGGEEKARAFIRGDYKLVPRDPEADLLIPVGESVVLPAVSRFVAKDAFTKANGITWKGDSFKQFILPIMEENVPEATVQVHELARDARNLAIAAELKVHERRELALAHFVRAIQDRIAGVRTDGWTNAAYVIGSDGETWAACARLCVGCWLVDVHRLGNRFGWYAGYRILSR